MSNTRLPHTYSPAVHHILPGLGHVRQTTGGTGVDLADGDIHFTPIQLRAGTVLDRISVHFGSTGTDKIRIGLYQQDLRTGRPGKLVVDLGTLTEDGAVAEVTIDYTVPDTDLYWIAALAEGAISMYELPGGGLFVAMKVGSRSR